MIFQAAIQRLLHLQFGGSQREGPHEETNENGRSLTPPSEESADRRASTAGGVDDTNSSLFSGGAVWALDGLLEPVAVRFRFHFEEDRPTNRVDSEWASVRFSARG